jgi:hypothetical protein
MFINAQDLCRQLVLSPAFPIAYRFGIVSALSVAAGVRMVHAATGDPGDPAVAVGTTVLGVILTLAGVAAAIGGAAVGLRLIIGSMAGSSYAMSQAVFALIGVMGGLALAMFGPRIAQALITAIQDSASVSGIEVPAPIGGGGAAPPANP